MEKKAAPKTASKSSAKTAAKTVKTATKTVKTAPKVEKTAAKTVKPAAKTVKTATKVEKTVVKTVKTAAKTVKTAPKVEKTAAKTVKTVAKTVKTAPKVEKAAIKVAPKATPKVEKNKYSPEELQEFKELILSKIAKAEKDLEMLQQAVAGSENDVSDTAPTFKTLEEGSNVLLKEENQKLAARQQKFIRDLRAALIRIENGTYGICQATGKLIPKERLMIVPHATMTVEAKEASKKRR